MQSIITPPTYPKNLRGPVIFLAGPIQGCHDWQSEARALLLQLDPSITVANPRRDIAEMNYTDDEQIDWETFYLRRAAEDGVIMFWLPKEEEHSCKRAYAQTSCFELGEWKERQNRDHHLMVVGIDDGFTNRHYIRRRLSQDCPLVTICPTLEETCVATIRLLRGSNNTA
jgi:hypothetical protein